MDVREEVTEDGPRVSLLATHSVIRGLGGGRRDLGRTFLLFRRATSCRPTRESGSRTYGSSFPEEKGLLPVL